MTPSNALKAYTRASHTVAKTKQVVMLYDGAVRFLQQAKVAMEAGDIPERFNKLVRVSDIIVGLQSCLDFEQGGAAAQALYDYYASIEQRLIGLHRGGQPELYDAIVADLKQMRDVWAGIDASTAATTAATSAAATAVDSAAYMHATAAPRTADAGATQASAQAHVASGLTVSV